MMVLPTLPRHIARGAPRASGLRIAIFLFLAAPVIGSNVSAAEIAILKSADVAYYNQAVQAFRATLPRDSTVTEYNLAGNLVRGREIAASLRAAPPDLMLAVGLKAALATKSNLVDTPTIFCLVLSPESHGLPTPNMIGISTRVSPEAQLASVRTVAPQAKRIGLLYDPLHNETLVADAQRIAHRLGLTVTAVPIGNSSDLPNGLHSLLPKIDLFWLLQDQTVVTQDSVDFILRTTLEAKVPVFGFSPTLVQQGALAALVVDARDIGRQAGALAMDILQSRTSSQQPLHDPLQPRLAINLASAKYFGMSPSKEVLRSATVVYGGPEGAARTEDVEPSIP